MRYIDFRDAIHEALGRNHRGMTWRELKASLSLPYSRPCPDWTRRLETEIGLRRTRKRGNALIWEIRGTGT